MRINRIENICYTGRIKPGDIKKAAKEFADKALEAKIKLDNKTENAANAVVNRLFKDPDNLKAVDYTKIVGIDCAAVSSTTASTAGGLTTAADTWSIYSTTFPSCSSI